MKCPICNFENSDDSKFCCGCGKTIPRCPTCGKVLTTRDRFCMNDGTRLPEELLLLIPEPEEQLEEVVVGVPAAPVVIPTPEATIQMPAQKVVTPLCASCGMPCDPGEDYCSYCRPTEPIPVANMDYIPPVTHKRPERKKKKKKGSAITVILVILLLLLIGTAAVLVAAEMEWIDLPDIFASEDSDRDRHRGGKDDEDGDGDSEPIGGNSDIDFTKPTNSVTVEATTAPPETTAPTTTVPTETQPQPTQPTLTKLEYFMENCDSMLFAEEDIAGFTKDEARYARNACYAQGGRKFKDKALQAYFEQYDWYTPTYEPTYFSEHENDLMNYYMKENLKLIRAYEKEMGFG